MKGVFITLEGGEGAGKTTQAKMLTRALVEAGLPVVVTREPGGSDGAEQIRALLVEGEPGRWDPTTEALLHMAARRDHLVKTVWPQLERGSWVVCDRFQHSTIAYQGHGHGLKVGSLDALYRIAAYDFAPDLTIVLDLPAETGLARARSRAGKGGARGGDRYERFDRAFHERVRNGFLQCATNDPERVVTIDARKDADTVHAAVLARVMRWKQRNGR